jgi:hypothetical protein
MVKQKWAKRCMVCQRMKADKPFRDAVMASTYFNPDGMETLLAVNVRYGQPFKMPTFYKHMKMHQAEDIKISETLLEIKGIKSPNWQRNIDRKPKVDIEAVENTVALVEGVNKTPDFEKALDDFIKVGRVKMDLGQIPISAANYIQAIKVKADIEMRTKDRRLEMLKGMFTGAAPKHADD